MAEKRKKLPKSIRKYIRGEKARIRREVFDLEEQKKLIEKLHQTFYEKHIQSTDRDKSQFGYCIDSCYIFSADNLEKLGQF